MLTRRLLPFACVLALGCDPNSESVGDGPESAEGSGSASGDDSTGGASGPTSDPTMDDSTPDGSTSGVGTTSPDPSTTGNAETGSGETVDPSTSGESSSEAGSSETGEDLPGDCELEPLVCDVVENAKVLPEDVVDCGTVTLEDDPETFAEVRACVLESSDSELAYKAFVERQGIDSEVWSAFGSLVGFVYSEHNWLYDDFQGEVTVWMADCVPTPSDDPECVPGPEFGLCLLCDAKHAAVCSSLE